jgi:protein-disulfide isomerase
LDIVPNVVKPFCSLIFAVMLTTLGCHAQVPAPGQKLSAEQTRRVEVMLRSRLGIPPDYELQISGRMKKSVVPGFDEITVIFTEDGKSSKPATFLLSADGNTLAQFSKFDISKDPKLLVSEADRPARGGPANAPVVVVNFDDLECPYCAKMHAQLFPALTERYKNQVRVVYRDFPLTSIHPWALRAAIDTSCMAAQSGTGYWNLVDYMHQHAAEFGGEEKSLAKANETLDNLTRDEGKRQKIDLAKLNACIEKQEDATVKASMKEGDALGVEATPSLFINGEKVDGAQPMEYVYRIIDNALVAAGQTPPPAPPPAPPPTASPATSPATPATKPGN